MRFVVGLALALALAGPCAAGIKIEIPPPVVVPTVDPGAQVQPVSFSRLAYNISEGQVIGELGTLISCPLGVGQQPVIWTRSSSSHFSEANFEKIFREEFAKAGLKVTGDPTNLFEQDQKNADLQIGALLTSINVKACFGPYAAYVGGSGVIKVEWQIYSVSAGKVIARIPSVAGASDIRDTAFRDLVLTIIQRSFAENVRQLAADPGFRKIVLDSHPASLPASQAPQGPLAVSFQTAGKPIALKEAATGAVVIFAGDGMGSGVLISSDGYILTNHHVASAGRVRIRWSDGTESIGQVVRADRRRDVALIKVDAPKGRPLAIRHAPVDLGETVFAIGTPLDDKLQNTVTRGIVSATRVMQGQRFIQSDTPVTHGNSGGPLLDEKGAVVGLSDLGADPSLGSTINFFIPIDDALKVLALRSAG